METGLKEAASGADNPEWFTAAQGGSRVFCDLPLCNASIHSMCIWIKIYTIMHKWESLFPKRVVRYMLLCTCIAQQKDFLVNSFHFIYIAQLSSCLCFTDCPKRRPCVFRASMSQGGQAIDLFRTVHQWIWWKWIYQQEQFDPSEWEELVSGWAHGLGQDHRCGTAKVHDHWDNLWRVINERPCISGWTQLGIPTIRQKEKTERGGF